jgi:hypothetical protein
LRVSFDFQAAYALAFRDERTLRASPGHAGFGVDHVYGDWDGAAPAMASPELIVIACKP